MLCTFHTQETGSALPGRITVIRDTTCQRLPLRRRSRRILLVVAGIILLFIISISTIVRLYTDLQWYREVRFSSVFWTMMVPFTRSSRTTSP